MSLVYIDGFDWVVNGVQIFDGAGRWSGTGSASSHDRITDTASGTGAAARMQSTSTEIVHVFAAAVTMVVGVRFRFDELPAGQSRTVFKLEQGGVEQIILQLKNDGLLEVYRFSTLLGTGTFQLSINTWYYLELKVLIDDTTGTVELRIDGNPTPDITLTSQDTNHTGTDEVDSIVLVGNIDNYDYDDLYLDNSTFHGDVFVETIVADGAGADADFTPSAGSNFENVEELPTDNDSTYNESNVVDDRDRFTHGDLPVDTDVVLGVQVGIWCKKTVAGAREVRTLAFDGTNESEGAAQTPGLEYTWLYDMFEDHPTDANPWTETEVNSGQFGYTVES